MGILILVLVLPIWKIIKKNKKILPILGCIVLVAIAIGTIILLKKVNTVTQTGADPRGGDTSVARQIQFLMNSPLNGIKVIIMHIINSLLNFNWYLYVSHGTFFGEFNAQIWLVQMIFILYVCITDSSEKIKKRTRIVSFVTFIAVFLSTSLMLYLAFTPVGQVYISGYQPRYIVPIIPMILMLINNQKCIGKNVEKYENEKDMTVMLYNGLFIIVHLIFLVRMI